MPEQPKKTPAYLLTVATLAGVASGAIGTAALTSRAAVDDPKPLEVMVDITPAQAASVLGPAIDTVLCPALDEKYGLSGATACAVGDTKKVIVVVGDEYTEGAAAFLYTKPRPGSWTPGEPE